MGKSEILKILDGGYMGNLDKVAGYIFGLAAGCLIILAAVCMATTERLAPASIGDKMRLISSAKNNEQKHEAADLLAKNSVTDGDVRILSEKFAKDAELKNQQVIAGFVNQNK